MQMSGNSSQTTAAWINRRTGEHLRAEAVTLRRSASAPTAFDKCTLVRHPQNKPLICMTAGLMGTLGEMKGMNSWEEIQGKFPGGRWSGREAVFRSVIRLEQHLKIIILLCTQNASTSPLKGCWLFKRKTEPDVPETKGGVPFHFLLLFLFLASAAATYRIVALRKRYSVFRSPLLLG